MKGFSRSLSQRKSNLNAISIDFILPSLGEKDSELKLTSREK